MAGKEEDTTCSIFMLHWLRGFGYSSTLDGESIHLNPIEPNMFSVSAPPQRNQFASACHVTWSRLCSAALFEGVRRHTRQGSQEVAYPSVPRTPDSLQTALRPGAVMGGTSPGGTTALRNTQKGCFSGQAARQGNATA